MCRCPKWRPVARLAGIGLYCGTMLEGGIGPAATAHVCSTFAALAWDTERFGPLLLTEEVLREPLVYRDFELQVPTGPGLGVEIDTDKLRSLQRKQDNASNAERRQETPYSSMYE